MEAAAFSVVMEGPLLRVKEFNRALAAKDIQARVLPPDSGCLNS